MSFPWNDVLSTGSAVIGAVAACAAWQAAARANKTADAMAAIEENRWSVENTPEIDFSFTENYPGQARVHFYLNGPDHLHTLDSVTIRVIDDDMLHQQTSGLGPTQEDLDNHVWGPWRFTPITDRADQHGRAVSFGPLEVGQGRPLSMERTRPGHWMDGSSLEQWQRRYADHPIRLGITCVQGEKTWKLARRIENPALLVE